MSAQASGRGQVTTVTPTAHTGNGPTSSSLITGSLFPETRKTFPDKLDRIPCYAEQGILSPGPRKYWATGLREPPDWPEFNEIPCKFPVNGPGHPRRKVRNGLRGPPFSLLFFMNVFGPRCGGTFWEQLVDWRICKHFANIAVANVLLPRNASRLVPLQMGNLDRLSLVRGGG